MFDGFSVYTLELFPGADWYHQQRTPIRSGDEKATVYDEFDWITNILADA